MQKDFLEELDNELENIVSTQEIVVWDTDEAPEANTVTTLDEKPKKQGYTTSGDYTPPGIVKTFPQVKFYLPTLRDKYTRFIPIGWNNETWAKNMNMIQYKEDILLIDCGIQFAEPDMLWASCSIPDVSFLMPYKKNIKGIIITHAHLDHIWALKHILPALGMPTIYWTKLTIWIIQKQLEELKILHMASFVEVDTSKEEIIKIWENFNCEFFRVNHSVPDCAWVFVETPGGTRIMHTWDFKIDFAPEIDKPADLARIGQLWKRWVTLFCSDSTGSTRKGFSTSEKAIGQNLEKIISHHNKWRLIITIFSSWISRVQQIINACEKYDKYIFLSGRSMVENIAIAKDLWYLKSKTGRIRKMTPKNTQWIPLDKQIIITTWSQWEEFSALTRMAEWRHNSIEILAWDTIVFSSSVVPGNEKSVYWVINKLIKLWANVITKDDGEVHTWGHAFQEEQKIMLNLVNANYFCPVFGDLYFRHVHKNTAMSIWMKEENVLLLDNWNIVDFGPDWKVFKSKLKVPIQELIVDGNTIWTTSSHVIQAREKMMNSWVLVLLFKIDSKTKAILWNIKLETRWLVYLEEIRDIHRLILKKAKSIYENTVKDIPEIDEKDLVKIIKSDLESYLLQKIEREPMVIPMITSV